MSPDTERHSSNSREQFKVQKYEPRDRMEGPRIGVQFPARANIALFPTALRPAGEPIHRAIQLVFVRGFP